MYGALNIVSATGIVFANKAVLSVYGFEFATALTLLHTMTTVLGMMLFSQLGLFIPKQVPVVQVSQLLNWLGCNVPIVHTELLVQCMSYCLHLDIGRSVDLAVI